MSSALRSTMPLRLVLNEMLIYPRVYGMKIARDLGLENATAYAILNRLVAVGIAVAEDEGLSADEKRQLQRPSRRYYSLTKDGRRTAQRMLDEKPLPSY